MLPAPVLFALLCCSKLDERTNMTMRQEGCNGVD
jgi:hypothetical protein